DAVEFRFGVTVHEAVDDAQVCLSITHSNGTLVSGPGTRDVGLRSGRLEGDACFRMRIDDIKLLPGTYEVALTLRDSELLQVFDSVSSALRFDVLPGSDNELSGLVTLRPEWSIER
ncbi:MAG: Wzt carbohydrate-binding domain-containing protein, partial [Acidimicrobiales bacterium]|nr:Wzt carbohydrate-binding domain-containing protein [Acidimicrobiales bacterium]